MAIEQHIFVAADAVVFGYIDMRLHVILIKRGNEPFKDMWALPGGFVNDDEDLEPAAIRELHEETNVKVEHMLQLYAIGTPGRDPRMRSVSVVYYTEIDPSKHPILAGDDAKEARWWHVNDLPPMAFDHKKVLDDALSRISDQ